MMTTPTKAWRPHRRGVCRNALLLVLAGLVIAAFQPLKATADTSVAGSQGTDTTIPATDSVVHVSGRGDFANLKIAVNQTRNLTDQAISVSWTGGTQTGGGQAFDDNFLQMFQCWGNDDGTNATDPGPPPTQCEFGYGSVNGSPQRIAGATATRLVSEGNWADFSTLESNGVGFLSQGHIWMPFKSVDTRTVNVNPQYPSDTNEFFNPDTTNEIDFAQTKADKSGQELFQAFTAKEAPGLGCGASNDQPDGSKVVPKCWLVVVPRGGAAKENVGIHPNDTPTIVTSPLAPDAWANRIAIPLDFNPIDVACPSGAAQRIVSGSELASAAANNWKPVLCSRPGAPPYAFEAEGDPVARQQLIAGTTSMAVTSAPLDPTLVDPSTPVVYAPMTLSGLVLGFNVERSASISISPSETRLESALNGTRIAHFNLTPRLVAKLLSQSYRLQFPNFITGHLSPVTGQEWLQNNPTDLSTDQEFIQYNPEFRDLQDQNGQTMAAPIVESRLSDASQLLWQWVLADPEAKAWLAGGPDDNNPPMKVNPRYNTDPNVNPAGGFGSPAPNSFPKSDPYCYQDPTTVGSPPQLVSPLCLPDVTPYALDLASAAQKARSANNGARYATNAGSALTPSTYYFGTGPEIQGSRALVAVTDSSSAVRFGLQAASLSRAGDDGANRAFIAPDQAGLLAGVKAMLPDPATSVLQPAPLAAGPGAYPLTVVTYAATMPATLDASARTDYARFVSYAAGDGQTQGFSFGNLLPGYVPLPDDLRAQANAAATAILHGGSLPTPSTTTVAAKHTSSSGGGTVQRTGAASRSGATVRSTTATPSSAATLPTVAPTINLPPSNSGPFGRTLAQAVGAIRYTAPVTFALGVAAAAAWLLDARRRKRPPGDDLQTRPET